MRTVSLVPGAKDVDGRDMSLAAALASRIGPPSVDEGLPANSCVPTRTQRKEATGISDSQTKCSRWRTAEI